VSSRPPWRDILALGVVAVVLRVAASVLVPDPAYLDAAYYELVARRLAGGDGLTVPVVWSFLETGGVLPSDPGLPIASNRHWMPLTSIVSAGSMAVFGTSRFAAELPHAILGALLVPATALVGWWLWGSRTIALLAGVLALFAGPMLVYVPMVDSFAVFGACGLVAILTAVRATEAGGSGAWLVLSGIAAALAMLTRIDGVLLGIAPATAWLARRGWGPWSVAGPPISGWWAVAGVVAAVAVVAPWFTRQAAEFGSILPSAGGRLLWITSYNEQFSITGNPTLGSYLDQGLPAIIVAKLDALVQVVGRTTVVLGGAFIAPFVFGLWRERRRSDLAPFTVYWLVLLAAMVLVFTLHAPAGAYYHSAWAWLPIAIPLAVANGAPLLESLGRRLPLFRRPRNIRFLTGAAVGGALILSVIGSAGLLAQWGRDRAKVETAAEFLIDHAQAGDVIMYVDPPSLNLLTGLPIVAPPFDSPTVIGGVARAYGVRWVVVERATGAEADALQLWDGAVWLADAPALKTGDVRIFATDQ
jgi:hypothetical protein